MEIYGLLGEKLGHSLSPEIHKMILKKHNLEGEYKIFEVPKGGISNFINEVKLLRVKGFNVTIPYKQSIMKYLDFISDEAKRIGAVNTVLLKENKLYVYNTDYFGIEVMLKKKNINVENKIAVILGTGGASKAMITYLLDNNIAKIYIVSRNCENVDLNNINNKIAVIGYRDLKDIKGDIIINCTPVGMYPKLEESPVDKVVMSKFNVAVDIVYNPHKTKFLKIAKEQGCIIVGGLYMLVGQAFKSQCIFNNIKMDNKLIEFIYKDLVDKNLV